ncbi:MFS transporter [Brucella pseudogrignonensis]|uniref:MFS transporter n=1 Tax=Brucella pseudogrignonensis TaxID=419475 RepID=UPI0028BAEFB3|nr:MFS transporter [Brucella pseudogrignonensis]MDT6941340.1 MFS transporter [Brucella pseudogrignonensis]
MNTSMMHAQSAGSIDDHERSDKPPVKAIAAAVAGNALEFYDFIVYSFFAVYIGQTFFPLGSETASLLASVAVFGVGFFTRPLGGVLIGAFADKAGRRAAMILTVTLITVGTLGLAATPGYETIGIAAPIIVLMCRLLQGLALGGEVGPASAMLVEAAPRDKRGLYASWQIASQGIAVVAGGLMGVLVSWYLTHEELVSWGWRIPFLVSLALIPLAVYIRRALPETLEKPSEKSGAQIVSSVFSDHSRYLILGILVIISTTVSTQVGNYMTTYAIQTLKLPATLAQAGTVLGGTMTFLFALVAGYLADKYGRKSVMIWPRIVLMLAIIPLFFWLSESKDATVLLVVTAAVTLLTSMSGAASLVAIPEMMPIALRATGVSLIYAIGATLFGGTTQFIITWLIGIFGAVAPAYYVVATSIISLVAMFMMPETRNFDVKR